MRRSVRYPYVSLTSSSWTRQLSFLEGGLAGRMHKPTEVANYSTGFVHVILIWPSDDLDMFVWKWGPQ